MAPNEKTSPSTEEYYVGIAIAVRRKANCIGNRVGAIIVKEDRVVSTGYNGTPEDMPNCLDGGCHRCANRDKYPSGSGYDLCICVHAEQNALLSAARFGIAVEGGVVYTTLHPCFGCMKEMLQAKINRVYYLHPWQPPEKETKGEHEKLAIKFPEGIKQVKMSDPDKEWAVSAMRERRTVDEHGHKQL